MLVCVSPRAPIDRAGCGRMEETNFPRRGIIHANRELSGTQLQAPRRAPCERIDVLLRGALRRRDACNTRVI